MGVFNQLPDLSQLCWIFDRWTFRSGTGVRCCICTRCRRLISLNRWQHSSFLREMTSWSPSWNYDVKSKIRLRQSMRSLSSYSRNNPAKFHPDPIWYDGALGFFEERHSKKNNKTSSDKRSVPDQKFRTKKTRQIVCICLQTKVPVSVLGEITFLELSHFSKIRILAH